jgi:hypothetical protein
MNYISVPDRRSLNASFTHPAEVPIMPIQIQTVSTRRPASLAPLLCLLAAWSTEPRFGALFGIGIAAVAALLIIEHAVMVRSVRKGDLSKGLNMAFFTLNGIVACILGALGIADTLF